MGANVQVCWEKFCRYWDVEPRTCRWRATATTSPPRRPSPAATRTRSASWRSWARPSTGATSPSPRSAAGARRARRPRGGPGRPGPRRRGLRRLRRAVPRPGPRLGLPPPRVASINTSGHKYGLVYPGVGWVVWRDHEALPERARLQRQLPGRQHADLRAQLLPAGQPRSWPSTTTFLRLGFEGYRTVQQASPRHRACELAERIGELGPFQLLTAAASCRCSPSRASRVSSTSTSSTSRAGCASAAGSCRPTRSPRTART